VFGRWGEVFGDDIVAAAMIDRLVHHAEVIALKDDSIDDHDGVELETFCRHRGVAMSAP
jgi:hypothetical protein